jgi:LmbE family N-acetylglucosaminyl deacetylase
MGPRSPGYGDRVEYEQPTWGLVRPDELRVIVAVSPHFDDVAMAAGQMLIRHAGTRTVVVTVFGGRPRTYPDPPTEWDALGGFAAGDDVVAARRGEDRAAMAVLGAEPVWLDFVDHQYLTPPEQPASGEVASALGAAIDAVQPTAVFIPMGLANPDHVVTHEASLVVRQERPDLAWFAYEDHGYKHLPGLMAWRVSRLFRAGLWPTPAIVPLDTDLARKHLAFSCYASQIPPLQRDHALSERLDANVSEQFWRIAPPPKGWESLAQP